VSGDHDERIIPADGRLITIDILRGLAILWVVVYHLWGTSATGFGYIPTPRVYYQRFWERLSSGQLLAASTASTDLVFRLGNNGVTVFMILSGVSLTISAMRSPRTVPLWRYYQPRLRKLLIPYWVAFFIYCGTLAAVGFYRTHVDGGTFTHNFQYLGLAKIMSAERARASLLIYPRGLDASYLLAPPATLWFVALMIQYYLLFPLLLPVLTRVKPASFALLSLAVSVLASGWLIASYGTLGARGEWWSVWFPFRFFEFGIGMAIGYAVVAYPGAIKRVFTGAPALLALAALGIALHTWGSWIADYGGYRGAISYQLVTAGFAALALALIIARPGAILTSQPMRLIAFIGTISYAVLIVNESFLYLNDYVIINGDQWTEGWWIFVVAMYVPLTVLFAYPLARVLGLLPKGREPARVAVDAPAPAAAGFTAGGASVAAAVARPDAGLTPPDIASADDPDAIFPRNGRLITIDILRGVAILWVIIVHLWQEVTAGFFSRRTYYERFADRIHEHQPLHALTAFVDLVIRMGDHGVTMFMILSGLSLTVTSLRRGGSINLGQFYSLRLRRLLVPYWAGWALFLITLAVLGAYRTQVDGGHFQHNFQYIGIYPEMTWRMAINGLLIVPRGLSPVNALQGKPPSLWFVLLLVQYYLLFPLLLPVLRRTGPAAFAALMLGVSLVSTAWMIWYWGTIESHGHIWSNWVPFRLFEFGFGMVLGYVLVRRPAQVRRAVARAPVVIGLVVGGLAMHTAGSWMTPEDGYWNTYSYALIVLGLSAVMVPIIVARPGFVLMSLPARIVAWVGILSYGALITNESVRLVNTYFISQGWLYSVGWWYWIVVLYVPLTVILAYPLASVLGLLPQERPAAAQPSPPLAPVIPARTSIP